MLKSKAYILLVFISFFSLTKINSAQSNQINFAHIFSENGLSQNTVHSIVQDKKGFMWFATEDGLDKFDGYNFTVYKHNPQDTNSISDNFIWTVYIDRNDILWIGTNSRGLSRFDSEREIFTTYKNDPNNPNSIGFNNVRTILEDSYGNLWVGTEGSLDLFDRKTGVFTHFKHDPKNPNSISDNTILKVFEDKSGGLWVGSNRGIDKFNRKTGEFVRYPFINSAGKKLKSKVILSIYEDDSGNIFLGNLTGIIKLNTKTKKVTQFLINPSENNNANSNRVNSIIKDDSKMLWIGTGDGLYHFNKELNKFTKINSGLSNSNLLTNNNVLSLYKDNSGVIWIGTAEDGIFKFNRDGINIRHFKHDSFNKYSLSFSTVRSIYQENDGTLWVGTLGGGLNRLKPNGTKFYHYRNNKKNKYSLSDYSISAITKDRLGYLWVGTWSGGLNRSLRPVNSKNYKNIKFINSKNSFSRPNFLSNNIIQAIYEDSDGNLWVGTNTGLDLYNRKKNRFINFKNEPGNPYSLSNNEVQSCIIEDRNGNLWIGSWNGLNKLNAKDRKNALIDPSSVKFIIHRSNPGNKYSLSDDRVISVYEDKKGNLWFGTYGGGVNKLSPSQQDAVDPVFEHYSIKDGLNSNIIYSIQGDDNGNIWMSSDNGLSMYNPKENKFTNYDINDGFQGNQFFWGAGFKGKNGQLFFGGTKGLYVINTKEIKTNRHIPNVVITDFKIFNQSVKLNEKDSILTRNISYTKKIQLSYKQNVFSIEFASLDFVSPKKNKYAYRMEGFDKNWIYSGNRRFVTYTNLDPGNYVFRVKGSNNDGLWNNKGISLQIIITPPFWKTWWFIAFATLLIGGLVASIIFLRIRNFFRIEHIKTKIATDLHDNIGSSLTGISILSEVISKKIKTDDNDVKYSLKTISENSRNLVDDLSDIVWLVNPKRESLYDLILRLRDTYAELLTYTSISFKSENIKSLEKVKLSMEHRQNIYLIFKEALNNCITHSNCTEIILDASIKGKRLEMSVKDNGVGFNISVVTEGNGLINMKKRAEEIGGSLQITESKEGGTIVKFIGNIL